VLSIFAIQAAGRWFHSPGLWLAQVIGLAVTLFGVALFWSGQRRKGPFLSALISMCVAVLLGALSTASLFAGVVPPLFLVDVGLEFMFVCWWAIAAICVYQPILKSDAV
jgi:hypothetical protein